VHYPLASLDIDHTWTLKPLVQTCYRCSQTGHISRDCDLQHDVRHITLEEEDEYIQHVLANHNTTMATTVGSMTHTATSEGTLVEQEVDESDFVRSNR
jgi:hypothetical protein